MCKHILINVRYISQGLATTNLSTTFELSISICYEDMKGDTKCRKLGGLK